MRNLLPLLVLTVTQPALAGGTTGRSKPARPGVTRRQPKNTTLSRRNLSKDTLLLHCNIHVAPRVDEALGTSQVTKADLAQAVVPRVVRVVNGVARTKLPSGWTRWAIPGVEKAAVDSLDTYGAIRETVLLVAAELGLK